MTHLLILLTPPQNSRPTVDSQRYLKPTPNRFTPLTETPGFGGGVGRMRFIEMQRETTELQASLIVIVSGIWCDDGWWFF